MKRLQLKYNLVQILYWISACALQGYVAIYLQYKGLTNIQIGIVTSISSILTIFISPYISSLLHKIKKLTINILLYWLFLISLLIFLAITYLPLSGYIIMFAYIIIYCLSISIIPLLSSLAMNYLQAGQEINFGLARGMGSVSYALSAILISQSINLFSPNVLAIIYLIASISLIMIIHQLPDNKIIINEKEEHKSLLFMIKKYKSLFYLLLGFAFCFAGAIALATYLINIIKNLGGNTNTYGIAIFIMSISELPVMALTKRLINNVNIMKLFIFAGICYLLRNSLIALAPHILIVYTGMLFQSMSYGMLTSLLTYYVANICKPEEEIMGQTLISIMTCGVGATIGNLFGGILQDTFGIEAMLLFVVISTMIGTTIMVFVSYKNIVKI